MEAIQLHHTSGREDHRRGGDGECVHVKKGQRRDESVFAEMNFAQAAQADLALAEVQKVEVAEEAAFRLSGSARGVEEGAFICLARTRCRRRIEMREH